MRQPGSLSRERGFWWGFPRGRRCGRPVRWAPGGEPGKDRGGAAARHRRPVSLHAAVSGGLNYGGGNHDSGAFRGGKNNSGSCVAQRMGFAFLDIDEFIWRKDTPKPFSVMYSREERIAQLQQAVSQAGRFVMAGSMDSFHQHFDPYFRLAVYLTAPAALRVERVHQRELEFGARVLPGGDMRSTRGFGGGGRL